MPTWPASSAPTQIQRHNKSHIMCNPACPPAIAPLLPGSGFWGFMTSIHRPSLTKQPFCYTKFQPYFFWQDLKKNALRTMPKVVWSPSKHLFPRLRWRPGGCPGSRNVKWTPTRFHRFLQNLPLESPPPVVNIAEAHGLARPVKKGHASNVTNVLTIGYQRCDEQGRSLPS